MSSSETTVLPLQLRAAAGDQHVLEGLCVPYGRTSMKTGHPRGERFLPGALADAVPYYAKIRLTDAHTPGAVRRPVGVATALRDTDEGLWGTFRFYATPEGRGAWENVLEDTYGGLSVAFNAAQERQGRDGAREIMKATLHHVALVDEPAYEEAKVLAVRAALPDISGLLAVTYDVSDYPDPPDLTTVVLSQLD